MVNKAVMQYISQSMRGKDSEIKDLFLDIGAEKLSHMEMVATMINILNGHNVDFQIIEAENVQAHVINGFNPGLTNSSG